MSLMDRILPAAVKPPTTEIPSDVKPRLKRGRDDMKRDAAKRRLCMRFERGETYWYVNSKGILSFQNTVSNPDGTGKPPHRVRNSYNLIRPVIQGKVSAATQRVPSYQINPSTTDQDRANAAQLSEKVALYGFDAWGVRGARERVVSFAIGGGGEGFALPYFDPDVGPYVQVQDPETGEERAVGRGEIRILVLNGNEVYWEPGCTFEESPWWAVERAVPIDDVKYLPGFFAGVQLVPDASTSDIPTDIPAGHLVMKTEYFERPCSKTPDGRYLVMANGKQVVPEQDYPVNDADGHALDEPVLHRLAWDVEGGKLREFGLTWQLIDVERTIQDALNKISEFKNRCLMPQILAPVNSITTRRTDEPGLVIQYQGPTPPTWEQKPEIPRSLFDIVELGLRLLRQIASDDASEQQADLTNVAAKTLVASVEQALNRWQSFMAREAEWDSRLMRHCLLLSARYYTEPRLIKIRGRDGWERIPDFQGADLMSEVDVRVFPDSLVPLTRQGVQDQLTWIAQTFPGWLNPQDALAAMQTGNLDRLTQSYFLDLARANNIIQKIRDGTVMDMPTRGQTDPLTGQPVAGPDGAPMQLPGWMPTDQDELPVWQKVFADWLKTDDYSRLPEPMQEVAQKVWDAIQRLKVMKAQREAMQQTQMAQQLGMNNASKPQGATPMPSLPGSTSVPPAQ